MKKLKAVFQNKVFLIGSLIVLFFLIMAIFPQWFSKIDPNEQNAQAMLQAPSAEHWFGTDNYGRDVFSRTVNGARIDLSIGIFAMLIPLIVGTVIGLIAGYFGGVVDLIIMRIVDIVMTFPFMVLVIAIVAILGPGINNLYIAIWIVGWKEYARLIRSEVMVAKNMEYVQAGKTLGYSNFRIIMKHILSNVISSAIVYAASDIVMCMIAGAGVSYLGLGVQAPTPEWGSMMAAGKSFITSAWWMTVCPGAVMAFAGLGFSLFGDGISDLIRAKNR